MWQGTLLKLTAHRCRRSLWPGSNMFQYDPMTIALMRIHFHPYKEDRDEMVIDVNWGFRLGECFHVSRWSTYSQIAEAWRARAMPQGCDHSFSPTWGPRKHRTKPIIVYSEVATPFSRCRAFCRWLLRAGHQTIKVERVRRLRFLVSFIDAHGRQGLIADPSTLRWWHFRMEA